MVDDPDTPWLDADFLVKVLRAVEGKRDDITTVSWKCGPAVPPGANFLSQLFRVVVEYRVADDDCTCTTSLIVKAPLPDGGDNRMEVRMYGEVFPEMFKLHPWREVPKSFPSPLADVIVMEDLREQGYRLYPREQLLDFRHCKEFLTNLSTFHAVSVRLYHECPELIESIGRDVGFTDDDEGSEKFWKRHLIKFASQKECADFAPKIRRKANTFHRSMAESFKSSSCLKVLNHNDLWLYNIMFGYDQSGELIGSRLLDFQSPKYCSFAADLTMFWWSSVDAEVRELHQEKLFEVYRQNLNKTLEDLNCVERVSKTEFDSEMRRFATYSLRPVSIHMEFALRGRYYEQLPITLSQMELFDVFL